MKVPFQSLKRGAQKIYTYRSKPTQWVQKRPVMSFLVALLILFGIIFLSNTVFKTKIAEEKKVEQTKEVQVYRIGSAPKIRMQAQVEKSGVIKITALSGGVIQEINVEEGQDITKGTNLIWMTNNYQGGNAFSVQRQIAAAQYDNVVKTFDSQKDLIKKQKEIAEKTDANTDQLRDIANQSLQETRDLITFNDGILGTLGSNQTTLEQNNVGGANDAAILSVKSQRAQLQGGLNQLRQGLRQAEFQAAGDRPPAQLSDVGREIALKQLEVQEKGLELQKEVSRLQLVAAQIQEATMHPVAPFAGKVERIHVRVGQAINPGTPLITISGQGKSNQAVVYATKQIAKTVSLATESTLYLDGKSHQVFPSHISSEATDGNLYAITFPLPDSFTNDATDKEYLAVDLTVGFADTNSAIPFVPLDTIYQSQTEAYLFVVENDVVKSRTVKLGEVLGRFVEIEDGLKNGDQVIVNRNIISGDKIKVVN